jgi:hypothetical protein
MPQNPNEEQCRKQSLETDVEKNPRTRAPGRTLETPSNLPFQRPLTGIFVRVSGDPAMAGNPNGNPNENPDVWK